MFRDEGASNSAILFGTTTDSGGPPYSPPDTGYQFRGIRHRLPRRGLVPVLFRDERLIGRCRLLTIEAGYAASNPGGRHASAEGVVRQGRRTAHAPGRDAPRLTRARSDLYRGSATNDNLRGMLRQQLKAERIHRLARSRPGAAADMRKIDLTNLRLATSETARHSTGASRSTSSDAISRCRGPTSRANPACSAAPYLRSSISSLARGGSPKVPLAESPRARTPSPFPAPERRAGRDRRHRSEEPGTTRVGLAGLDARFVVQTDWPTPWRT